jgi:hypothetical protein
MWAVNEANRQQEEYVLGGAIAAEQATSIAKAQADIKEWIGVANNIMNEDPETPKQEEYRDVLNKSITRYNGESALTPEEQWQAMDDQEKAYLLLRIRRSAGLN